MKLAVFVGYVAVEVAAFVGLVYAIGFWWTLLLTLAAIVLGVAVLRRQGARIFAEMRLAQSDPGAAARSLTDAALLAFATVLFFVPGLVTTVVGILLMLPPVRALARPAVAAVGARRMTRVVDRFGPMTGRGVTVIDGEVVDPYPPTSTTDRYRLR
ncbi:MAG: FxsA family protein [Williamsia herbipolensis]|uniref:UPF0716 protein FxsA n=1 Tax=Williamsia serinedens TaxID=391736 RepID=A0ABT1H0M9_9NOCA|nr:FxsA family protein [Williamsia serinedens]MBE7160809.1 FxsA family protein [Williamsia herbipolensis]MCP2159323.1 UPF0716 protein FxsA [Williamsia serinedens]